MMLCENILVINVVNLFLRGNIYMYIKSLKDNMFYVKILIVNVISRVQLHTVGFHYLLSKLVGSSALHVVGFYYIVFSFLVTNILQYDIHILVNTLTYFFLKSFFLCYLLSLSESFFQFYYLVWFQT